MGNLFGSPKKTTTQVLEQLEKDISHLEHLKKYHELRRKKILGYFLFVSIVLYITGVVVSYFVYFRQAKNGTELAIQLLVAFAFLVLIVAIRWLILLYFSLRLQWDDESLCELRQKRREILDNVKDTETYTVAKEILEKYDPAAKFEKAEKERLEKEKLEQELLRKYSPSSVAHLRHRQQQRAAPSPAKTAVGGPPAPLLAVQPPPRLIHHFPKPPSPQPPSTTTTQRLGAAPSTSSTATDATPRRISPSDSTGDLSQFEPFVNGPLGVPGTPRMARPVLPQERTPIDKVVDYLLGDGPSNRFALICRQCHAHNGMALEDEFEYLAFRCCYCFAFNPAHKQRQMAPKIQVRLQQPHEASAAVDNTGGRLAALPPPPPEPLALENTLDGEGDDSAVAEGADARLDAGRDDGHEEAGNDAQEDTIPMKACTVPQPEKADTTPDRSREASAEYEKGVGMESEEEIEVQDPQPSTKADQTA